MDAQSSDDQSKLEYSVPLDERPSTDNVNPTPDDWFSVSIIRPMRTHSKRKAIESPHENSISCSLGMEFSQVAAQAIGQSETRKIIVSNNQTPRRPARLKHPQTISSSEQQQYKLSAEKCRYEEQHSPSNSSSLPAIRFPPTFEDEVSMAGSWQSRGASYRPSTSTCSFSKCDKPREVGKATVPVDFFSPELTKTIKPAPSCPGFLSPTHGQDDSKRIHSCSPGITAYKSHEDAFTSHLVRETTANGFGLYRIQEVIGKGNFSQVKLATHILTKELVAIKILDKTRMDASTRRLLLREISILEQLHHPNIVRLYEVMDTLTRVHLVMEYVAGGDLNKRILRYGKFTEPEAKIIFAQLVAAVNHLHERNIWHRDIKADNILFAKRLPDLPTAARTLPPTSTPSIPKMGRPNRRPLDPKVAFRPSGCKQHIMKWLRLRARNTHVGWSPTVDGKRPASSDRSHNPNTYLPPRIRRKRIGKSHFHNSSNDKEGNGMIHNHDSTLCPENYRIKLADFGFSKLTANPDIPLTTFCGSPAYAAPELFEAQNYRGGPVDMWALGIVLFFLVTGLLPYRGNTVGLVRRLVLENRGLTPPEWLSNAVSSLYLQLTSRSPEDRPTSAQLIALASGVTEWKIRSSSGELMDTGEHCTSDEWGTWLTGQRFPKDLPRFSRSAPILCSLRGGPSLGSSIGASSHSNISLSTQVSVRQCATEISQVDTSLGSTCNSISMGLSDAEEADIPRELRPIGKALNRDGPSACGDSNDEAELEAARLLLGLGVSKEEIAGAKKLESRSAVTGAYRIILHQRHRARRLSRLDTVENAEATKPDHVSPTAPYLVSGSEGESRRTTNLGTYNERVNARKKCRKRNRPCVLL